MIDYLRFFLNVIFDLKKGKTQRRKKLAIMKTFILGLFFKHFLKPQKIFIFIYSVGLTEFVLQNWIQTAILALLCR